VFKVWNDFGVVQWWKNLQHSFCHCVIFRHILLKVATAAKQVGELKNIKKVSKNVSLPTTSRVAYQWSIPNIKHINLQRTCFCFSLQRIQSSEAQSSEGSSSSAHFSWYSKTSCSHGWSNLEYQSSIQYTRKWRAQEAEEPSIWWPLEVVIIRESKG
jgi:hypothetical protein